INAVIAQIDDPDISLSALMKIIPCPDFPTGGYLLDSEEICTAYETGRGKLTLRAKTEIETLKNGKKLIVVHELPYQVNKAKALEEILRVAQEKKTLFAGISDIRDESDRMGMRAVIEVKKDADAEKILQYLYKYSDLQITFGVNMVAIAEGKPQQMGLKQMIAHYIAHQENVVTRRTQFDLDAAERREHILEGLMVAILNIDAVIALIRASKTPKEARDGLMQRFNLSEIQAQAILDLRLQRLTNLELLAIEKEYKEVKKKIRELKAILGSEEKLRAVIKTELIEIRDRYGIPRRTQLIQAEKTIAAPELETKISEEAVVLLLDGARIRRMPKRTQPIEGERVITAVETRTDRRIKFFTNLGACFTLAVDEIPESKPGGRPINLNSILTLEKDEMVVTCMEEPQAGALYFFTKQGNVKRTEAAEYLTRTRRVQAISLKEGDQLLGVQPRSADTILLITKLGMSIRFETDTVPEMGRVAGGVKCIKLDAGDEVCFFEQIGEDGEILVLTDRGYAKRSFVFDYDIQGRNGKGLKTFDFKKNGSNGTCIAAAFHVKMPFDFVVEQKHGTKTEVNTELVRIDARAGKGMLLVMTLLDDVVTCAYQKQADDT
ncbi:MAG: DNA gyrase subunit A, partial [bacterium]|nr:DNA gyrase subunit A [bacterium]